MMTQHALFQTWVSPFYLLYVIHRCWKLLSIPFLWFILLDILKHLFENVHHFELVCLWAVDAAAFLVGIDLVVQKKWRLLIFTMLRTGHIWFYLKWIVFSVLSYDIIFRIALLHYFFLFERVIIALLTFINPHFLWRWGPSDFFVSFFVHFDYDVLDNLFLLNLKFVFFVLAHTRKKPIILFSHFFDFVLDKLPKILKIWFLLGLWRHIWILNHLHYSHNLV